MALSVYAKMTQLESHIFYVGKYRPEIMDKSDLIWDYSFSTYAKNFLTPWNAHVPVRILGLEI